MGVDKREIIFMLGLHPLVRFGQRRLSLALGHSLMSKLLDYVRSQKFLTINPRAPQRHLYPYLPAGWCDWCHERIQLGYFWECSSTIIENRVDKFATIVSTRYYLTLRPLNRKNSVGDDLQMLGKLTSPAMQNFCAAIKPAQTVRAGELLTLQVLYNDNRYVHVHMIFNYICGFI